MTSLEVEFESVSTQQAAGNLHAIAGRLVAGTLAKATRNNSFIINDIPRTIFFTANPEWVATILHQLFTTVTTHCAHSCIRISATCVNDLVTLQVREQPHCSAYNLAADLQSMQLVAEKLGGYLGISTHEKTTTITFSFLNERL